MFSNGGAMQSTGCIVVDFDGTIAFFRDYENGEYVELNAALAEFGIPLPEVQRIYRNVRDEGFSSKRFVDALSDAGYAIDRAEANAVIQSWLLENLAIFSDAVEAITLWTASGIEVFVVTTGEYDWQRQKVDMLDADFSAMLVMTTDQDKLSLIQGFQEVYGTVIAIDDKPGVLDALRDTDADGTKFRTVRMFRMESKYRDDPAKHTHLSVTTFLDPRISALAK